GGRLEARQGAGPRLNNHRRGRTERDVGMKSAEQTTKLQLVYTIFCDDVRLEVGNKLSLMGVFHQIAVQQFPVTLLKFAVVSQWRGEGRQLSEVRILTPDRRQPVVLAEPSPFAVPPGGSA